MSARTAQVKAAPALPSACAAPPSSAASAAAAAAASALLGDIEARLSALQALRTERVRLVAGMTARAAAVSAAAEPDAGSDAAPPLGDAPPLPLPQCGADAWHAVFALAQSRGHLDGDCAVCLQAMGAAAGHAHAPPLALLSCAHALHGPCLDALEEALRAARGGSAVRRCPLCRLPYERSTVPAATGSVRV